MLKSSHQSPNLNRNHLTVKCLTCLGGPRIAPMSDSPASRLSPPYLPLLQGEASGWSAGGREVRLKNDRRILSNQEHLKTNFIPNGEQIYV